MWTDSWLEIKYKRTSAPQLRRRLPEALGTSYAQELRPFPLSPSTDSIALSPPSRTAEERGRAGDPGMWL